MVGLNGLEPSTSRLSGVRSNQLSYRPIKFYKKRVMGIEPTSVGTTIRCVNHFATTAIKSAD